MNSFQAALPGMAAVFTIMAGAAQADESPFYGGARYAHVTLHTEDDLGTDLVNASANIYAGMTLNKYFSIEADLGLYAHPFEENLDGWGLSVEITSLVGAFGVGQWPVSDTVTLFSRLGYLHGTSETTITTPDASYVFNDSHDGYGAGLGATFRLPVGALRTEYGYFGFDGASGDAFQLGFQYKF